jgi:hypothetical protein
MAISEGNFSARKLLQFSYNSDVWIGYKEGVNGRKIFAAWVLCSELLVGCHHPSAGPSTNLAKGIPQNVFKAVERQVPELKYISQTGGPASGSVVWQCKEYASATFLLWKNPRYHPLGEFPREPTTPVPYVDVMVTVARYGSAGDALHDLKKSLWQRQVTFQLKENYKGGTLYEYHDSSGGVPAAICQFKEYVIEVNCTSESAEPLTLKTLDAVVAEINSPSRKP